MSTAVYARSEVMRTFRNRRFFIFSLIFPLTMYLLIAGPNRGEDDLGGSGISAPLYYMVGLIGFGTMMAVTAGGARIAEGVVALRSSDDGLGFDFDFGGGLSPLVPREFREFFAGQSSVQGRGVKKRAGGLHLGRTSSCVRSASTTTTFGAEPMRR